MTGNGSTGHNRVAAAAVRFQSDSRLVGLVRERHDVAFEEIVRRYRPQLVAFAGAIVSRDHAEDVVQEALTKAHGAIGRGDSEINLRPWLYTIVRNRALNSLRDEPVHEHLDENFDGVPQPPEVATQREELASLIAGVRSLPGPQREAIVRRELEGRSHDEIAASLGTTPGAVRGLIYRARTALRDGMGVLIPLPVLRAALGSGPAGSNAAGAGGAAAAGLAAGGGGVAMKAGATLGVAVIAVGSGIAIQHRTSNDKPDQSPAAANGHARSGAVARSAGSGFARASDERSQLEAQSSEHGGPGSGSDDSGGRGENSGPSASSGPGGGSTSGHDSSGEGPGSGESGHGGSSGSGSSGSGSSGSGDGGSGGSSGTSGTGSSVSGGSGATLEGGSSGSGSSGSGSGGSTTTTDDGGGGISGGSG
jgi:RNA polymerase sigma factor (sigma-70 family)